MNKKISKTKIRISFLGILISMVCFLIFISSCATTPKITRMDVSQQVDLSGDWNDTDSQLVASEMIKDALSRPWIDEFIAQKKHPPRIVVGTIKNRSMEHINTQTFVKDLEREILNSGRAKFVASMEERKEIREEKIDQSFHADASSQKALGQEKGADFMIRGQINTIMDEAGNQLLKYYQVELEAIDILTNEKVWIGQKKIKKLVQRPKVKF
jgi:uncharacterized protein (TIGR02722 family)